MNYFKQIALVFGAAWGGRKYAIKSSTALRAFIRVAPDVVRRLDQELRSLGTIVDRRRSPFRRLPTWLNQCVIYAVEVYPDVEGPA